VRGKVFSGVPLLEHVDRGPGSAGSAGSIAWRAAPFSSAMSISALASFSASSRTSARKSISPATTTIITIPLHKREKLRL